MNQYTNDITRWAARIYQKSMEGERPSAGLDAVIDAHIRRATRAAVSDVRRRGISRVWRAAAASVLVAAGTGLWLTWGGHRSAGTLPDAAAWLPADASGQVVRLADYPLTGTEAAVFRLRARLGAGMPIPQGMDPAYGGNYLVDVRMANDGSMRILRVIPANRDEQSYH
jgi:hypothetical protein